MSAAPNFYKAFLAQSLKAGTAAATIYVDRITTLTGETLQTADFATFGRGILTVNPQGDGLTSYQENISFTAVDGTNIAFTGATRGLDKAGVSQTSLMRFYSVDTPVIISFGTHNIQDFIAYIAAILVGSVGSASDTVAGVTKLTKNWSTLARARAVLVEQQVSPDMTLQIGSFAIGDYVYTGGTSPTMVAPVANPRIDLIAYDKVAGAIVIKNGAESGSPSVPQMSGDLISIAYVFHRVGETVIKDTSDGTNAYIYQWCEPTILEDAGFIKSRASTSVPTGYLAADGSSISCHTYPELARAMLAKFGYGTGTTATFDNTTDIVTASSHGFVNGDPVFFDNSGGGLPTGISANTIYYVISALTNTFQISTTKGGSALNFTSNGTGTNTVYGNVLLPNIKGSGIIGTGQRTSTATIASVAANVITATGVSNIVNNHWQTGQAVVFHSTVAGNLVDLTTYYLIQVTPTTFSLASSLANAQNATVITLAGTERGTLVLTFTSRAISDTGGEENHAMSITELLSHTHGIRQNGTGGNSISTATTSAGTLTRMDGAGGNASMNNMQPFIALPFLIRY